MHSDLSLEFLRVVEQAAIECAHTMGQGDRHNSDQVAVEAMRKVMDTVPIDGTIVIGEGERDEAPMLYIGEKVGLVNAGDKGGPLGLEEVDIAVKSLISLLEPLMIIVLGGIIGTIVVALFLPMIGLLEGLSK